MDGTSLDADFGDTNDPLRVVIAYTEENPDGAGSSRLQAIQTAAQRAGLDFFAPALRPKLDEAISRIRQRAEMITPLLREILHRHHPALHWGINE